MAGVNSKTARAAEGEGLTCSVHGRIQAQVHFILMLTVSGHTAHERN
jgi:hypothetical protein